MTLSQVFYYVGFLFEAAWQILLSVKFEFGDVTIYPLLLIIGFVVLEIAWLLLGELIHNILMKGEK